MDFFLERDTGPFRRLIARMAVQGHSTPEVVKAELDQKMAKAYSVLQYLAVLGFAAVPWLLYRKQRPYYLQHVIFSIHVYSFYFLLTGAVSVFLHRDQWLRTPLPLVTAAYLFFAIRRLYGETTRTALAKAVVLRIGLLLAEAVTLGAAVFIAVAWWMATH